MEAIDEFEKLGSGVGIIRVEGTTFEQKGAGGKAMVALPMLDEGLQGFGLGGQTGIVEFMELVVGLLSGSEGDSFTSFAVGMTELDRALWG